MIVRPKFPDEEEGKKDILAPGSGKTKDYGVEKVPPSAEYAQRTHEEQKNHLTYFELQQLMESKGYIMVRKDEILDLMIKEIVASGIKKYGIDDAEEILKEASRDPLQALEESEKKMDDREKTKIQEQDMFLMSENRMKELIKNHFDR